MREHFHKQREKLPEKAVRLEIVLLNSNGAVVAIDADDPTLLPLRLLDPQGTSFWSVDADDDAIVAFLNEAILEHKEEAIGLSRPDKFKLMVSILTRKIRSLDIF